MWCVCVCGVVRWRMEVLRAIEYTNPAVFKTVSGCLDGSGKNKQIRMRIIEHFTAHIGKNERCEAYLF